MSKKSFHLYLSCDDYIQIVVDAHDHEDAKERILSGEYSIEGSYEKPEPRWHELTGDYIDANLEEAAA